MRTLDPVSVHHFLGITRLRARLSTELILGSTVFILLLCIGVQAIYYICHVPEVAVLHQIVDIYAVLLFILQHEGYHLQTVY